MSTHPDIFNQAMNRLAGRATGETHDAVPAAWQEISGDTEATYSEALMQILKAAIGSASYTLSDLKFQFADLYGNTIFQQLQTLDDFPINMFDFTGQGNLPAGISINRNSTGTYLGRSGILSAAQDTARFQRDKDGNMLGLLIEGQRTNGLPYSEDYSQAEWSKTRVSVTEDTGRTFGIIEQAYHLVDNTDNSTHIMRENISKDAASETWTASAIVEMGTMRYFRFYVADAGLGDAAFVDVDLQEGTLGTVQNSGTFTNGVASIEQIGTNAASGKPIYRVRITADTNTDAFVGIVFATMNADGSTTSYAGTGTDGFYIYASQLEEGEHASSYIQTTGTAATRLRDEYTASLDGSGAGTVVVRAMPLNVEGTFPRFWTIGEAADSTNYISCYIGSSKDAVADTVVGGASQGTISTSSVYSNGDDLGIAMSFDTNDLHINDGSSTGDDTTATLPDYDTLYLGMFNNNTRQFDGIIKNITVFNTALTDAGVAKLV